MPKFFPKQLFKDGWYLFFSKTGLILMGINGVYFLLFGVITLGIGIFTLGPAAFLLGDLEIVSGILAFFLILIFIEIVFLLIFLEVYVMMFCLYRYDQKQVPMFNYYVFDGQMPRFLLYFKSCLYASVKVAIGLLLLIVPGVQAFFRYVMVGPVAVFEFKEKETAEAILEKSATMTKGKFLSLAVLIFGFLIILVILNFILGRMMTQFFVLPILFTYLMICLFLFYKNPKI